MSNMASWFVILLILCSFATTFASPTIVSASLFNKFFPSPDAFYKYSDFIAATQGYSQFGNTGNADVQKRELAAYFANVKQETEGLKYIREINRDNKYCDTQKVPCPAGEKAYYGRGPLQLTWNYNYDAAGNALKLNLLQNPDQVATNAPVAWKASLFFWMQNSQCHSAMTTGRGFGDTIRAINGVTECGKGSETQEANNRIKYYTDFCSQLGVSPGSNLGCA